MTNADTRTLTRDLPIDAGFRGAGYHGSTPCAQVVSNWHDETHAGAFLTCSEQPCAAVRAADNE